MKRRKYRGLLWALLNVRRLGRTQLDVTGTDRCLNCSQRVYTYCPSLDEGLKAYVEARDLIYRRRWLFWALRKVRFIK